MARIRHIRRLNGKSYIVHSFLLVVGTLPEPVQAHGDEILSDVVARIGRETAADDNHGYSNGHGHGHSLDIVLCADPHIPRPEWWRNDCMGEYGSPLDATQWLALRDTVVALQLGEVAVTFYRQRWRAG